VIGLDVESGSGPRRIDLLSYLDAAHEERAHEDAYAWIKAIRHLRVDGEAFRSRFTFRGDSLWWFAELYLHKEQAILNVLRVLSAFDALVERDRPLAVTDAGGPYSGVIAHAAAARKVRYAGPGWPRLPAAERLRMEARTSALAWGARLSRLRSGRATPSRARIAAFVHRAFWRSDGADGSAESYIGPVLRALEGRVGPADIRYIGVGPGTNFRARRWWHRVLLHKDQGIVPIERFAPERALAASRVIYRDRHAARHLLWNSAELRAHAVIRGCDCWPIVGEQLAGIALLQFPWSARAMDEAAAALEAVAPDVAVTYAEAGGWGRALALECRRRRIPLAGLQHGFIYRHWLNYRHEPDEAIADARNTSDQGFPFPAATLLFDDHAARHLTSAGHFPPNSLAVTGSPRFDELAAAMRGVTPADIEELRRSAGIERDAALVLFAAKEREARHALPALSAAVRAMPGVHLVIKPHPAETPEVYGTVVAGARNISVAPAGAELPALLAAARAVVTVNSTVAIDALAFGLPSVVIGLPNNLTPFVESGRMLGAGTVEEIRTALSKVLYDQEFRSTIERGPAAGRSGGDGQAATRSAEAILALAARNEGTT
jgi:hypothetical protein